MLQKMKAKIAVLLACCMSLAMTALCFAEEPSISSQIGTAATNAAGQITPIITTLIPIVLGVLGTVIAVKAGIRLFKSFMKTSSS